MMSLIKHPTTIPCGKVLGHGECCQTDHLCGQCVEISILRESLEFYAHKLNYIIGDYDPAPVRLDQGHLARITLGLPSEEPTKQWSYF